ncbi:hypothetical protein SSX86_008453 [Deinandra increscens subsp. villosa]|uniref:F-box domain-containing protein n=1 Tax=Deinandra increscens subsp. villosa TaxID=3103831 RepID=A0AAP0DCL1_9ASTR
METLEEEEEQSTMMVDRFPNEIIDDILSRLPVKSILRSRSVSKPWLSRISDPSFTILHFARHRTAVFIAAYDTLTRKRYFLSAAPDGGPVTHLITFDDSYDTDYTAAEHLNGLVCFTCTKLFSGNDSVHAFIVNPSTRQMFKIPHPPYKTNYRHICFLFGFDECRNEHKILVVRKALRSTTVDFMVFCMSNYTWRKINADPPADFSWDRLSCDLDAGVCVNGVVHMMLLDSSFDILGFDFKLEKLSFIRVPQAVVPRVNVTLYHRNGQDFMKSNKPFMMNINGCLGVVCHDSVTERNEIHVWILRDYDNRVWVKEIVTFPESWIEVGSPLPLPVDVYMDEIIFSSRKVSGNVIRLHVYNMKTRCFKSLPQVTLDDQFVSSENMRFNHIKCYVENIMPL